MFVGHGSMVDASEHTLSAGHGVHWDADMKPSAVPYVPGGHGVHAAAAWPPLYVPGGQAMQVLVVPEEYFPAGHIMHESCPAPGDWYR